MVPPPVFSYTVTLMLTRDYPWHLRAATHAEHRWFTRLVQVHELTNAWIQELNIDRAPYLLDRGRGIHRETAENLWMVRSLGPESRLEAYLDDTSPGDVLARLEHTVWAAQAYTLRKLIEKTPEADRAALDSSLEQAAWKLGRKAAETLWKDLDEAQRSDLRNLILLSPDIPFISGRGAPLVQRSLRNEARLELLHCAHQMDTFEVASVADELCSIHGHWIRGFAYGLNPRVVVERRERRKGPRCELHWQILQNR